MPTTHLSRRSRFSIYQTWCGLDAEEMPEGDQHTEDRHEMDCDACWKAEQRKYDYDSSFAERVAYLRSDR